MRLLDSNPLKVLCAIQAYYNTCIIAISIHHSFQAHTTKIDSVFWQRQQEIGAYHLVTSWCTQRVKIGNVMSRPVADVLYLNVQRQCSQGGSC